MSYESPYLFEKIPTMYLNLYLILYPDGWSTSLLYAMVMTGDRKQVSKEISMEKETKRKLVYGALNLVLVALANRLALLLTNKLMGEPKEALKL